MNHPFFSVPNGDVYPPFKNGRYLEEYFCQRFEELKAKTPSASESSAFKTKRTFIPLKWTNFQIHPYFNHYKSQMQSELDNWVTQNQNPNGYFTVVQHDDGPVLRLPIDTIVFGACTGDIPIPLIYEDVENKLPLLGETSKKSFSDSDILCSFVGCNTGGARPLIFEHLKNNQKFDITVNNGWTASVDKPKQDAFIEKTLRSKFVLGPRGYGRGSFRFFEIFHLGAVPVYVWDDIEWLPYKDVIDYSKFCISIHVSEIDTLEDRLSKITEGEYTQLLSEYKKVEHHFTLEGMTQYILSKTC